MKYIINLSSTNCETNWSYSTRPDRSSYHGVVVISSYIVKISRAVVTNQYCLLPCALEKIIMTEVSGHISMYGYQYFYCCKLNLIHSNQKDGILPACYQYFLHWKISPINAYQHSQHLKKPERRNSETAKWKVTEQSRLCKAETDQTTKKSSWYIKKFKGKEKERCLLIDT